LKHGAVTAAMAGGGGCGWLEGERRQQLK